MRKLFQLISLLLFIYLLYITSWPPPDSVAVNAFLKIDPLLSLQTWIATGVWIPAVGLGILLLVLTLFLGRFFCGWMCPMGTTMEWIDRAVYGKKRRLWKNDERHGRWIKYAILLVILIGALTGQGVAFLADPICWITRLMTYALWPMVTAAANGGLDAARPLFEGLGWFGLARMEIAQPVFGSFGIVAVLFFSILIWLNRYQRRFWCRHLCPLGALLAIPARFSLFHRKVAEACDKDGKCARTCETGAIGKDRTSYDPGECIQCGRCVPDCHLSVTSFIPTLRNRAGREPKMDLTRRRVVGWGIGGLVGSAWLAFSPGRKLLADEAIRPPGALPEDEFLASCVRCGQCIKACPTHCLQPALTEVGVAGLMSPVAVLRLGQCDPHCNACGLACPTGAIQRLELVEKPHWKIGMAIINKGRCLVYEQGKVCLVCDENCPYAAINWSEENGKRVPSVNEEKCNGCGHCEYACPVDGISAIRIHPNGQTRYRLER